MLRPFDLFKPNYLFDPTPSPEFPSAWVVFAFFVLLFAASFWAHKQIVQAKHPRLSHMALGGIPSRMREFALIGLLFTFFRDQNIPYLGMRFWLVLVVVGGIAYGVYAFRNFKKAQAEEFKASPVAMKSKSYLPQPKKTGKKKKR